MIKYTALTHIGNYKTNNEDYFYCAKSNDENLLYIVCDGVGGYPGGEIASKFVVEYILKNFDKVKYAIKDPLECLKEITIRANQALILEQQHQISFNKMGTTIAMALIISKKMYFVSVGDSRIYQVRTELKQLTADHNLLWDKYLQGLLTKEEMRVHPENNIITSMLGRSKIKIDSGKTDLKDKDKILLCSDGLTDMIPESEIKKIFDNAKDVEKLGLKLLDTALENGGKDNITMVILSYEISK